jgi:SAM-dependent methyltransferase
MARRAALGAFLARNPFPHPLTVGFFYREKMRAIHRVAPDGPVERVLEVGGGRSGLARLLYPGATVVTVDLDPTLGAQAPDPFACASATRLPFADATFDLVTCFDLFEHVPDDRTAAAEALRVLRPGGTLLASTPSDRWRYPYYRALRAVCPTEDELFREWGHVRRGYSLPDIERLVGSPSERYATFISPATALCHDIAFSRLPTAVRVAACSALAPLTWTAYLAHRSDDPGTETALAWRKT